MSLFLICVCLLAGFLWGWASCAIRDKRRDEIDEALKTYGEFQAWRDAQCPEMIGKWGKL